MTPEEMAELGSICAMFEYMHPTAAQLAADHAASAARQQREMDYAAYLADEADREAAEFAEWAELVDESAQAGMPVKINREGDMG